MLRTTAFATLVSVITLTPWMLAAASAEDQPEKLKVVASFSIIADFAGNVGGERIDVTTLVGPDGDAHVYEPKPADAAAVAGADVVLANGLQFEGFLQRLVEASGTKAPVVELTRGGEMLKSTDDEHQHDRQFDPHAWQSVHNAEIYVKNIVDAFCAADADGCDTYKANGEAYAAKLEALDTEIRAAVASIPEEKRVIITSHDAFGYFQHEYGVRFLAPEGVSTESEASAADVAALIKQIRDDKASAIFVENITNPRLVEQIAAETGVKVGGTLYSDALSGRDGPASTYIDMMRHNMNTIEDAVTGS